MRVIHIRVDNFVVLGLLDLIEQEHPIVVGCSSVGLAGRAVLTAVIEKLQSDGVISDHENASADEIERRLGLDSLLKENEKEKTGSSKGEVIPISTLRELLQEREKALMDAQVKVGEVALNAANMGNQEIPEVKINMDKTKKMSIDIIRRVCPLDRFVVDCKNNTELTHAVEIVYGNIPVSDWSSDTAAEMITRIYNQILKIGSQLETANNKGEDEA